MICTYFCSTINVVDAEYTTEPIEKDFSEGRNELSSCD